MQKLSWLILLTMVMFGCENKQPENQRSGAYGTLDMMSQMRAYPNADIPKSGLPKCKNNIA